MMVNIQLVTTFLTVPIFIVCIGGSIPTKKKELPIGFPLIIKEYVRISSGYGIRKHPILHIIKKHEGIDITAPTGTLVYATSVGTVIKSGYVKGYGHRIIIKHSNGVKTLYAHLEQRTVSIGEVVKKGEVIGTVGATGMATGPHLHYEIWINGNKVDPLLFWKMFKENNK